VTRRIFAVATALLLSGCGAQLDTLLKKSSPPPVATPPPPPVPPASPPPPAPPAPPAPRGGTTPSQLGPLRPELPAEEEQRLADGARQNIVDVERVLAEVERRQLKPPQQEAFQTAKNFLDQARAALGQRDYQRAANLASKARALTDDIAGTTK
jgi:hypothetical protein